MKKAHRSTGELEIYCAGDENKRGQCRTSSKADFERCANTGLACKYDFGKRPADVSFLALTSSSLAATTEASPPGRKKPCTNGNSICAVAA